MDNLEKYLGDLGRQEEKETKEIEVKTNPRLEEICKEYERWLREEHKFIDEYESLLLLIEKLKYSLQDVILFSLKLTEFEDKTYFRHTGYFISALVNQVKEEEYTIITEGLNTKVDFIGFRNNKKLIVRGDVGDFAGFFNKGEISIEGNVGVIVGYKNKGYIFVNGNAGNNVGIYNKGVIKVDGEIESLASSLGTGRIYHKGKLIAGKENE